MIRALLRLALIFAEDIATLLALGFVALFIVCICAATTPDPTPVAAHVVTGPVAYAEAGQ